jgi:hypothetical protein
VKSTVTQPLEIFPTFYGIWRFITVLIKASARWISPYHPILFLQDVLIFHLHQGLTSSLFPSGFAAKPYMHSSSVPCVVHALPISSSLTWSFKLHLMSSTSCEAHYAVFSTLPLFHPSSPILLSTPFPNAYTKLLTKLLFCIFKSLIFDFSQQMRRQRTLNWMVASNTHILSALNFLMYQIFICHGCSQIFDLCHILKGSISYLWLKLNNTYKSFDW